MAFFTFSEELEVLKESTMCIYTNVDKFSLMLILVNISNYLSKDTTIFITKTEGHKIYNMSKV